MCSAQYTWRPSTKVRSAYPPWVVWANLGKCARGEGQEASIERPWGPDAAWRRPIRGWAGLGALLVVRIICIPRVHRAGVPHTR